MTDVTDAWCSAPGTFARAALLGLAVVVLVVLGVFPGAVTARAGDEADDVPRGPSLGNVRYVSEIGPGPSDVSDEFVTPLIRGEVVALTVTAGRGSPLRPTLTIVDPAGVDRSSVVRASRDGRRASARGLVADRTGNWTVRVAGTDGPSAAERASGPQPSGPPRLAEVPRRGDAERAAGPQPSGPPRLAEVPPRGTTGTYGLRCRIRSQLARRFPRQAVSGTGADAAERVHEFEAVEGATLSAVVRLSPGSARAGLTAVTDPSGVPVALGPPRGGSAGEARTEVVLGTGAGAYAITVGLDEGSATYALSLRVRPPVRPRGTIVLSPDEPWLAATAAPIAGNSASVVELVGSAFSRAPLPEVWFGGRRASVLSVSESQSRIAVVPPVHEPGAVVGVAIVNPDGQAVFRGAYFGYVVPEPARLDRLSPATASVYAGGTLSYVVALSGVADWVGAEVGLSVVGAPGAVPASVIVPPGASFARVDLAAAAVPGTGRLVATWQGRSVSADVTVVPRPTSDTGSADELPPLPEEIDVGGWMVEQNFSARVFAIPPGTVLKRGQVLVIGRAVSRDVFAAFWGVTLGPDVLYVEGGGDPLTTMDDWPSVNGSEVYVLRDPGGVVVDGPTTPMGAAGGENLQRIPGGAAAIRASWTVSANTAPGGGPTPGSAPGTASGRLGVYISEFSDAAGPGNYPFEFVEIRFDGKDP